MSAQLLLELRNYYCKAGFTATASVVPCCVFIFISKCNTNDMKIIPDDNIL